MNCSLFDPFDVFDDLRRTAKGDQWKSQDFPEVGAPTLWERDGAAVLPNHPKTTSN